MASESRQVQAAFKSSGLTCLYCDLIESGMTGLGAAGAGAGASPAGSGRVIVLRNAGEAQTLRGSWKTSAEIPYKQAITQSKGHGRVPYPTTSPATHCNG